MIEAPAVTAWKAEGMTKVVIHLLKTQIPSIPEEVEAKIRACRDEDKLTGWAVAAARASNIDEFRQDTGL